MSHPPTPNFHASHWKNRAACQTSWHALETSFGRGESFLETVKAWQSEPASKPKLFFTAFTSVAPTDLSTELAQVCYGLLPGALTTWRHGTPKLWHACVKWGLKSNGSTRKTVSSMNFKVLASFWIGQHLQLVIAQLGK